MDKSISSSTKPQAQNINSTNDLISDINNRTLTLMFFEISFQKLIRTYQTFSMGLKEITQNFRQFQFVKQPSHEILQCFSQMIAAQFKTSQQLVKIMKEQIFTLLNTQNNKRVDEIDRGLKKIQKESKAILEQEKEMEGLLRQFETNYQETEEIMKVLIFENSSLKDAKEEKAKFEKIEKLSVSRDALRMQIRSQWMRVEVKNQNYPQKLRNIQDLAQQCELKTTQYQQSLTLSILNVSKNFFRECSKSLSPIIKKLKSLQITRNNETLKLKSSNLSQKERLQQLMETNLQRKAIEYVFPEVKADKIKELLDYTNDEKENKKIEKNFSLLTNTEQKKGLTKLVASTNIKSKLIELTPKGHSELMCTFSDVFYHKETFQEKEEISYEEHFQTSLLRRLFTKCLDLFNRQGIQIISADRLKVIRRMIDQFLEKCFKQFDVINAAKLIMMRLEYRNESDLKKQSFHFETNFLRDQIANHQIWQNGLFWEILLLTRLHISLHRKQEKVKSGLGLSLGQLLGNSPSTKVSKAQMQQLTYQKVQANLCRQLKELIENMHTMFVQGNVRFKVLEKIVKDFRLNEGEYQKYVEKLFEANHNSAIDSVDLGSLEDEVKTVSSNLSGNREKSLSLE